MLLSVLYLSRASCIAVSMLLGVCSWLVSMAWDYDGWHEIWLFGDYWIWHNEGYILFANHKANGVVTNIGLSR